MEKIQNKIVLSECKLFFWEVYKAKNEIQT